MKKRVIIYFCLLSLIGLGLKIEKSYIGDFVAGKRINLGPVIVYEYRNIPPRLMCLDCAWAEKTHGFPFAYLNSSHSNAWLSAGSNSFNIFYLILDIIIYFAAAFIFSWLICLLNKKILAKKSISPSHKSSN